MPRRLQNQNQNTHQQSVSYQLWQTHRENGKDWDTDIDKTSKTTAITSTTTTTSRTTTTTMNPQSYDRRNYFERHSHQDQSYQQFHCDHCHDPNASLPRKDSKCEHHQPATYTQNWCIFSRAE